MTSATIVKGRVLSFAQSPFAGSPTDAARINDALFIAGGRIAQVGTFDDLRAALNGGLRKVVLWTDQHGGREALFEAQPFDPFFNVNTPEDLAQAEAML